MMWSSQEYSEGCNWGLHLGFMKCGEFTVFVSLGFKMDPMFVDRFPI